MSIKVIILGMGAMGSGMARLLLKKPGISLVSAYEGRVDNRGQDLGQMLGLDKSLGIKVLNDLDEVLSQEADLVLQATTSFTKVAGPQIEKAVRTGKNVISIAEEMFYPRISNPVLANRVDQLAKENNATVLGTGINPGFVLDSLVLMLTGACQDVTKITATRINDLSAFGETVMRTQGVGATEQEFYDGIEQGTIVGHIGFSESITLMAETVGWELDEITQTREPIISKTHRATPHVNVEPGMVAGCKHVAFGIKNGEAIITLNHPQQVHPELEGIETGDYISIEGSPDINIAIKPEIPGGISTIAMAVNMIPHVINAGSGLLSMKDLPIPRAILGDVQEIIKKGRE
ncbi:MAG TPA: 2,4-diaminopentanoate dehydrogenase [bacterium]|nr:2,4-diaminopentanoate dehydrogenase [bacterium]